MQELDTTASARAAIDAYTDPYLGILGALNAITDFTVTATEARVSLRLPIPVLGYEEQLRAALQVALARTGMPHRLILDLGADIPARGVQKPLKPLPGIRNIIAV